jgi:hypothetical protein
MQAMSSLLTTMRNTAETLGKTIDCLDEQTDRVAEIGPAIGFANQVSLLWITRSGSHHARLGEFTQGRGG